MEPGDWAERVAAFKAYSAVLRELSMMRFLNEIVSRGVWWWDEWRPARTRWLNRVDFDILPVSEHQVTFFVVSENCMSVWTMRWQWATSKSGGVRLTGGEGERLATFASPFIEPFHVAAADGAYFFVTEESGEVYVAEEANGEWKTRSLWNDPNRPIIAMLTQCDSTAAFVFGKDFYFRLARHIEPTPCADVTKGRPDLGDPMRTVLQCARVLYRNAELKKADTAK